MKIDSKKVLGFARSLAVGMATTTFFASIDQFARVKVNEYLKKRQARIEEEPKSAEDTTNNNNQQK